MLTLPAQNSGMESQIIGPYICRYIFTYNMIKLTDVLYFLQRQNDIWHSYWSHDWNFGPDSHQRSCMLLYSNVYVL